MMKEVYVVNCCRTAIGSYGGSLKDTPAVELGALVIKEALKRANVAPEHVDEVMFGCILTSALGQNPARQAAVKAGVPLSAPAYTVGMVCGSGMKSVIEGARAIKAGDANIVVCGGYREHVRSALRHSFRPLRRPHGQHPDGGYHDQGRPVGSLQQLPHGHHC